MLALSSLAAIAACVDDDRERPASEALPKLPIEVVEGDQPLMEDYEILGAVRKEIWADERVGRRVIGIDVHRGVVTLTGTVHDATAKRRAIRTAKRVAGVRGVVDRIQVRKRPYVERRQQRAWPADARVEGAP